MIWWIHEEDKGVYGFVDVSQVFVLVFEMFYSK